MNKLSTLVLLFAFITNASGQYLAHYEKKALSSFYSKDYSTALLYSEKVIEVDGENVASLFVAGESARIMQDLEKAESYLEKIPDEAKAGYYSVTDYRLGSVKHDLAKVEEAKFYYEKYLTSNNQENDLLAHLADRAIEGIDAGEKERRSDLVQMERLGDNINSELSELAPIRYADKLYFTSVNENNYVRSGKKRGKEVPHPVTRIYEAQFNRPAREIEANPRKASKNASNVALMPDASRMYYTLCNDDDYRNQEECEIWYRERQFEGDWGPPVRLPQHINMRGYSSTQPTIGYDRHLRRYVLYFSSDRPGGKGGLDIWASVLEWNGTNFGEPFPLPVNTEKDEVTPFYHQSSQTLFFSSDGLPTQGGLDIYKAKKANNGEWEAPESLDEYVNSEYDDLYYTYHTSTRNAYFVSDRPGSNCKDKKDRGLDCTDIYQARIFVDLELKFLNAISKVGVNGTQVELTDLDTDATATLAAGNERNDLRIRLEPGKDYKITVHADGYQSETITLNTDDISYFTTLEKEVLLDSTARP